MANMESPKAVVGPVMNAPYWAVTSLQEYYLEDSWVRQIMAGPGLLVLVLDAVLRETHPEYQPPHDAEQYCYRRAFLTFTGVQELEWKDQLARGTEDASGTVDFGTVDVLEQMDDGWRMAGDFGTIRLRGGTATLELVRESSNGDSPSA